MFTGIITDMGTVTEIERRGDMRARIRPDSGISGLVLGASIASNGVCLTVVELGNDDYAVDISAETISKTSLGQWQVGSRVNLERPLRLGDELGGHMVSGHVDGLAQLIAMKPVGDSFRLTFVPPAELMGFIVQKGSVALDGISLTVNDVRPGEFDVNIIPHTQSVTNLGQIQVGNLVNIEVDMLARYVAGQLREKEKLHVA